MSPLPSRCAKERGGGCGGCRGCGGCVKRGAHQLREAQWRPQGRPAPSGPARFGEGEPRPGLCLCPRGPAAEVAPVPVHQAHRGCRWQWGAGDTGTGAGAGAGLVRSGAHGVDTALGHVHGVGARDPQHDHRRPRNAAAAAGRRGRGPPLVQPGKFSGRGPGPHLGRIHGLAGGDAAAAGRGGRGGGGGGGGVSGAVGAVALGRGADGGTGASPEAGKHGGGVRWILPPHHEHLGGPHLGGARWNQRRCPVIARERVRE